MLRLITLLITLLLTAPTFAAKLPAGPMLGHVALRAANIWAQAPDAGTLGIEYWVHNDRDNSQKISAQVDNNYGQSHIFKLSSLEPGTSYRYQLLFNGEVVNDGAIYQLTTQTLWQWRTDPPDFEIITGSCNFENEGIYDRSGEPYGGQYEIFDQIATEEADMMLWLGDNWYYREVDFDAEQSMLYRVLRHKSFPYLQPIFQKFANYATWDDHDYGPDNSTKSFVFKEQALAIFKHFWANPSYGMPDNPGVYTKVSFNDVDFFLLDNRYYRDHENKIDGADKAYYGTKQLNWLKNQLLTSKAPFKFIVGGGQMLNNYHKYDGWDKYRYEREPFLQWLNDQKISGVMMLSGDKHHTELLRANRDGAYPLYELTCSPLTAGTHIDALDSISKNPRLVDDTLVGERNYCKISFSGPRKDRRLEIKVLGVNGQEYWRKQIKSSVLSYSQVNTDAE
ncbi:alkaline phosphatase D family protein [Marinicella gelatinilytica]|uniref:alkaline phosphatase D family protein n=1 Tax=Marinicella gelatinilytica TaxID=2996017 RepID=UPI00226096A9|nr:alkaline phosphatase D family protein [Marinicella gelatinilytica]MCX7544989.1 alkaline phosphatase D family protein [Marinicella gelatinilytica]